MNISEATRRYEAWLANYTPLHRCHLVLKHARMREDVYSFLRATFYRWVQIWPEICPELNSTPKVLAVGDPHVENFGTWRDSEGRLIWGINDFDEAYPLPYANDLVRLASSALLAIEENHLELRPNEACEQILAGYREGLGAGSQPFVLEEQHKRLRMMAFGNLRNPRRFWRKLWAQEKEKHPIPANVSKMFDKLMPEPGLSYQLLARVSGLGSLGRYRVVAIADWRGGKVAREIKALAPSACVWTRKRNGQNTIYYQSILDRAVRCRDPFVQVNGFWLGRRLSPHCCRIAMDDLPTKRDESHLLHAGKPLTWTKGTGQRLPLSREIWQSGRPAGCIRLPTQWPKRPLATGRIGKTETRDKSKRLTLHTPNLVRPQTWSRTVSAQGNCGVLISNLRLK